MGQFSTKTLVVTFFFFFFGSHLLIRKVFAKPPALFSLTHSILLPSVSLLFLTSLRVCQEFCNLAKGFFRANYFFSSEPKIMSPFTDRKRKKDLVKPFFCVAQFHPEV